MARATVRKYVFAECLPCHGLRGPEPNILDPSLDHLHARLGACCENAMQLWRELRALGFRGTPKQVRRWLSELRTSTAGTTVLRCHTLPVVSATATGSLPPLSSSKQLSWHLLRDPDDLDSEAAVEIARVLKDEESAKVIDLSRRFCWIVRSRCGADRQDGAGVATFYVWLSKARTCGVRVVESFAASLNQDGAAVRSGLCLPWSSGQAEGRGNRLKLLKRSMYGRAKLDLLRQRFLPAA